MRETDANPCGKISPVYRMLPLTFARAEGVFIHDQSGRAFYDMAGSLGVAFTGHAHPEIVRVIRSEAVNGIHVANNISFMPRDVLADRLCRLASAREVFFGNSGTEAVECALKTARLAVKAVKLLKTSQKEDPDSGPVDNASENDRISIFALEGSFHGRSMGSLSCTHGPSIRQPFEPMVQGTSFIPFPDLTKGNYHGFSNHQPDVIILEPVSGQTMRVLPDWFVQMINECSEHGTVIISDESQSGMWRTGTFLASDLLGIKADIIVISKSLGGGLPLSACIMRQKAADILIQGLHGSTFGGNALAVLCANRVLDLFEGGLSDHVKRLAAFMDDFLNRLTINTGASFRGIGLMRGIVTPSSEIAVKARNFMFERGTIVDVAGNLIRLYPPAVCETEDIEKALKPLREFLVSEGKTV